MLELENTEQTGRLLCNRQKSAKVFLLPSGRQFEVVAEMKDEVHHMRITIRVNQPSLKITQITCDMPGVPDALCRRAKNLFDPLIGHRVLPGLLNKIKSSPQNGCTHLVNLFHEACYNITLAQSVLGREELTAMFPQISEAQLYHIFMWFRPEIQNSCVRYADNSPFMGKVRKVEMPAGAQKLRAIAKNQTRQGPDKAER